VASFFVTCYLLGVAADLLQLARTTRPAGRRKLLNRTARELDLVVDPATAPLVIERLVRRERVTAAGSLLIWSIVLPVYAVLALHAVHVVGTNKPARYVPLGVILPWASVRFGQVAARSGLMMYEVARRTKVTGPRVARVRVPVLTDYVRPLELWAARLVVLVAAPVTTVVLISTAKGNRDARFISTPVMVAGVLFAVALLIAAELTARRLLALGQPASTEVELTWDDALRSRQLRELYLSVMAVGLVVTAFSLIDLNLPDWTQMPLLYGTLGAIVLLGVIGKPAAHYRRRLWPATTDRRAYEPTAA
jgi:hypothetical protein